MRLGTLLICFLTLTSLVLLCSSCGWSGDFNIETTSPQGTYRLIFEGKADPPNSTFQSETVTLKVLKRQELFFVREPFFKEDALDPHFRGLYPALQWLNDSTLRMGEELSAQPFFDEITVYNQDPEKIDVVEIFYGRDERFLIFDFAPGTKVELKASPQFKSQWGAASHVFYRAYDKDGHSIVGGTEGRKRKSEMEGASKYSLEVVNP